ncbi:MAG: L,D-transpeptidase family protein [Terrimicrobiaceae bacterium]
MFCSRLGVMALGGMLVGCAIPEHGNSFEDAAYATVYLGPDGRIVQDPRAAKLKSKKKGKKSASDRIPTRAPEEGYWRGDGVSGSPSITINLGAQKAFFYKGGELVGMSPISSGREGYSTPAGRFRVTQKNADHVSNLYGNYVDDAGNVVVANVGVNRDRRPPGTRFQGAPMPYFMRIVGAVGMHGGYLPGYPASHGCIRLPMTMAQVFYDNAASGTPVSVIH